LGHEFVAFGFRLTARGLLPGDLFFKNWDGDIVADNVGQLVDGFFKNLQFFFVFRAGRITQRAAVARDVAFVGSKFCFNSHFSKRGKRDYGMLHINASP
jgi:hypothetical protein